MAPSDSSKTPAPPADSPTVNVFAVHGVEPEIQAYAMAKYSRSALSMKESLRELSEQRAEQFLNTFYFQYGHRSIADLAHLAMAVERLSLLAAIVLVDESRWDGQERSTRYQNFRKSGFYTPDHGGDGEAAELYRNTAAFLFAEYEAFSQLMFEHLAGLTPRPEDMKADAYERTLKARAFDLSRYLLPLATNTSLGQIVNARTLESQISRLLSHTHAEVRNLGTLLRTAATQNAYNVNHEAYGGLVEEIRALNKDLGDRAERLLLKEVRVAPTLVKYAEASQYAMTTRNELRQAAMDLMGNLAVAPSQPVELISEDPLETEVATTLIYQNCHYSYAQIRDQVAALPEKRCQEIIDLGLRHRGPHDELLRPYSAGQSFRFDILMDIGGFRDMHRHRRCIQIEQDFTTAHGYEMPPEIAAAGAATRYAAAMERAATAAKKLSGTTDDPQAIAPDAQYLIPLAFRTRALFKMDLAEALYIAELRTTPAGHYSYRKVAYCMYEEVAKKHPGLARYFRVKDITEPVDLLKR